MPLNPQAPIVLSEAEWAALQPFLKEDGEPSPKAKAAAERYKADRPSLTPAHGGCRCICHSIPGIMHFQECCHPQTHRERARDGAETIVKHMGDHIDTKGAP
jgi:hypothetical protein